MYIFEPQRFLHFILSSSSSCSISEMLRVEFVLCTAEMSRTVCRKDQQIGPALSDPYIAKLIIEEKEYNFQIQLGCNLCIYCMYMYIRVLYMYITITQCIS